MKSAKKTKSTSQKSKTGTNTSPAEFFTPQYVLDALTANDGNVAATARALKVERATIYGYVERYPDMIDLPQIRKDAHETLVDLAEDTARQLIEEKNVPMTIFTLKTQGRHRGWQEKVTLELSSEAWVLLPKLAKALEAQGVALEDVLTAMLSEINSRGTEEIALLPDVVEGEVSNVSES
jgi:hypothetical protein